MGLKRFISRGISRRDSDYYSRQDPTIDWNYEEEVTASHAVRTRWTYTFTNADYDAAVAQQFAE